MKNVKNKPLLALSGEQRFLLFKVCANSLALSVATIVAYWNSRGVSLEQGLLLQTIFSIAVVVCEVPTGYFADLVSRRGSLAIGIALMAIGELTYGLGNGFGMFLAAELLFALGLSFLSGADEAYLREYLAENGELTRFRAVWGRAESLSFYSAGGFTLLGSLLSSLALNAPFIASASLGACGVALALSLPRCVAKRSPPRNVWRVARDVLIDNRRLRWFSLASAMMWATLAITFWQQQPVFDEIGVPLALNGALLLLFNVTAGRAASFAGRNTARSSALRLLPMLILLAGVLAFVAGWSVSFFSVVVLTLQQAVRGFWNVRLAAFTQPELNENEVATARSVMNMAGRLGYAAALVPATFIVGSFGPAAVLMSLGLFSLGAFALLGASRRWYG